TGIGEQRDELAVSKARRRDRDVIDLTGSHPRIIGDENFPRRKLIRRKSRQEMLHRRRHSVYVSRRTADGLCNHSSPGIENAAGEILALTDNRTERGSNQRVLLLVGHR